MQIFYENILAFGNIYEESNKNARHYHPQKTWKGTENYNQEKKIWNNDVLSLFIYRFDKTEK